MNTSKGDSICPNKVLTLVYVLENEKVLLGLKKRGFGEGKVGNEKLNNKYTLKFMPLQFYSPTIMAMKMT